MTDQLELAQMAARQCLTDWARVRPGEQVLLLRDTGDFVEDAVVAVFRDAVAAVGAEYVEMRCRGFNPRAEDPPPAVIKALEGSDVVLFFSPLPALLHSPGGRRAMLEYGLRIVPILTPTLKDLSSPFARFPAELQLLLHRKCQEVVHRHKQIRVTSRQGTDLSGIIPDSIASVFRERMYPGIGWHGIWPGEVGPALQPMRAGNGRLVVDVVPGFPGILKEKVIVEIKDSTIARIAGGEAARWFENLVNESLAKGTDANQFYELQWGVNPKGDIQRAVELTKDDEVVISRLARTVHFGFGSGARGFHWDVVMLDGFDITVGDEVVARDGHLTYLDDPEVRQVAARYGDPDEILYDPPLPI